MAKIWLFSNSDDLLVTAHNLAICKGFKIRVFTVKNMSLLWGGGVARGRMEAQKANHCFSSTHMPVLKGIHGSSDATCLPSSPCLHKWARGEADDEKKFT